MKTKIILRIVIYAVILTLFVSTLAGGLFYGVVYRNGVFSNTRPNKSESASDPKQVSASGTMQLSSQEVQELEIDWVSGSVFILPGDADIIQISESGKGEGMDVRQEGNRAVIHFSEETARKGWTGKNTGSKDLTVLVPWDWNCEVLEINAASANVTVSDFAGKSVTFDSASGQAKFQNCQITNLKLNSVSGDLEYQGSLTKLQIDAFSADADILLTNVPRKVTMEAVSGSMNLTLPQNAGFTLDQSLMQKHFQCDFPLQQSGNRMIAGDGACDISFSGLSGNLRIHSAE